MSYPARPQSARPPQAQSSEATQPQTGGSVRPQSAGPEKRQSAWSTARPIISDMMSGVRQDFRSAVRAESAVRHKQATDLLRTENKHLRATLKTVKAALAQKPDEQLKDKIKFLQKENEDLVAELRKVKGTLALVQNEGKPTKEEKLLKQLASTKRELQSVQLEKETLRLQLQKLADHSKEPTAASNFLAAPATSNKPIMLPSRPSSANGRSIKRPKIADSPSPAVKQNEEATSVLNNVLELQIEHARTQTELARAHDAIEKLSANQKSENEELRDRKSVV